MTDVPIENLTIDETTYVVGDLPEDVQQAVRKYEEWRDRFAVAQDEVALVGAALRDLGAQIVGAIRAAEAAEAATAEVDLPVEAAANEVAEEPSEEVSEPVVEGETLVVDDA
jgi:hypothetical protein